MASSTWIATDAIENRNDVDIDIDSTPGFALRIRQAREHTEVKAVDHLHFFELPLRIELVEHGGDVPGPIDIGSAAIASTQQILFDTLWQLL